MLLEHLRDDYRGASQAEKLSAFRNGVRMIQQFVGLFTIADEFTASFPGILRNDISVFVGGPGPQATPIIAFAPNDKPCHRFQMPIESTISSSRRATRLWAH